LEILFKTVWEEKSGMGIRVLAQHLGLSITTVSRALAGYSDVSAATRARVEEKAAELGYRPNASARRLKTGRADAIGLLLPAGPSGFGDPFLAELIGAVGAALAERELDLVVTAVEDGAAELPALRRLVTGRKVDGVIVPRTRWHDPRVELLLELGFPFVTHGRSARSSEHAWLDIDGERAFSLLAERLIAAGHRRITMLNAPESYAYAVTRAAGFRDAAKRAGIGAPLAPILPLDAATAEEAEAAVAGLFAAGSPPTAIACATDQIAYGVIAGLRAIGRRAGRDVAVVGYDDLPLSAMTSPPLTTMRQPIRREGRRMVEMLLDRIAGRPAAELAELWQAELVERESDACRPA
jgi:LacI family transcriptional regulator